MGGVLPVDTAPTHKEEYITKQSRNVWFSPLLQDSTLEEILLFPGVELKNETSESLGNITLNRTRYTLFKAADNVPPAVDLKLQYPQLSGMEDKETEWTINLMLFDIAFKSLGDSVTLTNVPEALQLALEHKDEYRTDTSLVAEFDYKVLDYTYPYLSLFFNERSISANMIVNDFEHLVTINVETAAYLNLTSVISMDKIETAILDGNFEVLSGAYSPGCWDAADMTERFIEALKGGENEEAIQDISDHSDKNQSIQQINVNGKQFYYSEYDKLSTENFGCNKECIFVQFKFYDSLNGYIILKIPLNAIKES